MNRAYVLMRQAELEAMRLPEERLWREIAEMLRPEDTEFQGTSTSGRTYDEIFDSSPLYAHQDFVGGLFSQATSPTTRWMDLAVEDPDLLKWKPAKDWLWHTTSITSQSFGPAQSSFYAEAPAWFGDIGAFGLGAFYSEEDVGTTSFIDRAIPLRESFMDVDIHGRLDTFHRRFKLNGRQIKSKFGVLDGVDDKKTDITIIHAVWKNPDYQAGQSGPKGKPYLSAYCSPDIKALWRLGGYYEMPYMVPMWNRRSGKIYPTGPGHIARADMRTLQEMERIHLVAGQFAAEPMTLVNAETDLTMSDFQPNALLFGAVSENGKELVRTLNRSQNVNLSMQQSQQRREAIREAFYFSIMQLVNRPQMTATEFLGFQEEKLRLMGPNLSRIQIGGLSPLVSRRFRMLQRADRLPPPPPELESAQLIINYVSPLAKMQKAAEGRAVMQWLGAVGQMAQIDPAAFDNVDTDAATYVLHDAFGPPPSVQRDPADVEKRREARAQSQARSAQLEDQQKQVDIAAGASHAAQAASMAQARQ